MRPPKLRTRVLDLLKARSRTNAELSNVSLDYTRAIRHLRREGHVIECHPVEEEPNVYYIHSVRVQAQDAKKARDVARFKAAAL